MHQLLLASCVTQAMMAAYYDTAANQMHLRLIDTAGPAMDFRLISAARNSAQFLSISGAGPRPYRLTYDRLRDDALVITLERAPFDTDTAFSAVTRWRFRRDKLINRR